MCVSSDTMVYAKDSMDSLWHKISIHDLIEKHIDKDLWPYILTYNPDKYFCEWKRIIKYTTGPLLYEVAHITFGDKSLECSSMTGVYTRNRKWIPAKSLQHYDLVEVFKITNKIRNSNISVEVIQKETVLYGLVTEGDDDFFANDFLVRSTVE